MICARIRSMPLSRVSRIALIAKVSVPMVKRLRLTSAEISLASLREDSQYSFSLRWVGETVFAMMPMAVAKPS